MRIQENDWNVSTWSKILFCVYEKVNWVQIKSNFNLGAVGRDLWILFLRHFLKNIFPLMISTYFNYEISATNYVHFHLCSSVKFRCWKLFAKSLKTSQFRRLLLTSTQGPLFFSPKNASLWHRSVTLTSVTSICHFATWLWQKNQKGQKNLETPCLFSLAT